MTASLWFAKWCSNALFPYFLKLNVQALNLKSLTGFSLKCRIPCVLQGNIGASSGYVITWKKIHSQSYDIWWLFLSHVNCSRQNKAVTYLIILTCVVAFRYFFWLCVTYFPQKVSLSGSQRGLKIWSQENLFSPINVLRLTCTGISKVSC